MGKISKALEKAHDIDIAHSNEISLPSKSNISPQVPPRNLETIAPTSSDNTKANSAFFNPEDISALVKDWDERLQIAIRPTSPIAENFKRLRSKILHPTEGPPPKSILVTSVIPGEGKGFVCANMGVTIAQSLEQHALMVDCDLRRPTLASLFGIPNDKGLSHHLTEDIDISLLIRKTSLPKLSLIPAGPPPHNPAELLNSKRMASLIDELVSRYQDRFILLDTPPTIAASETADLAKHVDGVILVTRWGGAKREHVKETVDAIGKDKIIGFVFNGFQPSPFETIFKTYGSHGYGKYAYGYYDSRQSR